VYDKISKLEQMYNVFVVKEDLVFYRGNFVHMPKRYIMNVYTGD